jgi:hypothetical protein
MRTDTSVHALRRATLPHVARYTESWIGRLACHGDLLATKLAKCL